MQEPAQANEPMCGNQGIFSSIIIKFRISAIVCTLSVVKSLSTILNEFDPENVIKISLSESFSMGLTQITPHYVYVSSFLMVTHLLFFSFFRPTTTNTIKMSFSLFIFHNNWNLIGCFILVCVMVTVAVRRVLFDLDQVCIRHGTSDVSQTKI